MLRFIESDNAAQAKGYYTEGLSREDYYTQGQEIAGVWRGKGAERLGLAEAVSKEDFDALCENRHPKGGPLTPRLKSNRRVGYDINFHCPKSVSVLYGLTGDRGILEAFRTSVRLTMEEMETEMQTRVRLSGKFENRTSGNLVWGEFVHLTARPVKGAPDPHLHAHCFAFNATWDEVEKRWKAGEFGELKANAPYFEAVFHARLSRLLRDQGYGIDRGPKGWEVTGVPISVIDKFSRRTAQIERLAEAKGITAAREKDRLGAATRENKRKGIALQDLRSLWDKSLSESERAALGGVMAVRSHLRETVREQGAEKAVSHAIGHAFERRSTISRKKLLELALRRGIGQCSVEHIKAETQKRIASGEVIARSVDGQEHCTTKEVIQEERAMLDFAREGRGMCRALVKPGFLLPEGRLSGEQRAAVEHLLTSTDRVMLLRGRAGVGKTTLMREAVAAIEANGRKVFAFAPSAEASRGILRQEGFAGADTVASLLLRRETQEAVKGQVIWIDEAGLLGSKTMRQIFELAEKQGARVILAGDSRQHGSVERGDAFRLLEQRAGLVSPEVKAIRRQRGTYREAIASLADGRSLEGFNRLDQMGAIREAGAEDRSRYIAADYLRAMEERRSALVISPTHGEGERITTLLRDGLRERGLIGPRSKERTVQSQASLGWTEAERADASRYESGQVIQFQQNAKGFRQGERLLVAAVGENSLAAFRADGSSIAIPVHLAARFQVYKQQELPLAPGDLVRFASNGTTLDGTHRVHNGSVQRLAGFTDEGDLRLENGWTVSRHYGHLGHGYVSTSYSAQGKTVDRVLISQGAESFAATSQEQFYVSASRGRESVTIYTDNREELLRAVKRSSQRLSATELLEKGKPGDGDRVRKQARLVNRLLSQGRAWASRQADWTPARDLLAAIGRPIADPGAPARAKEVPEVIRRYGRMPPPPDKSIDKEIKRRGREREL